MFECMWCETIMSHPSCWLPFFPYHSTRLFAFLAQSQDSTMPGRVPQIHFSLFSPRNGRKISKGVRLVWTGFCMKPARGFWLPWKHMHFSICRKRSSFDWLCTPVLCPTTGFGVTTDCSKHPEKPSLSVVGCSGGDGFCDLAGGLHAMYARDAEDQSTTAMPP